MALGFATKKLFTEYEIFSKELNVHDGDFFKTYLAYEE